MSDTTGAKAPTADHPSTETPKTGAAGGSSATSSVLKGAALWAAVFAIAVWIAFSVILVVKANANETEWTRLAWVFGSIQAVAFAAAGALFGTSVQQQNVSNAQQLAASAKQEADQNREDATRGRALATVMQAEADGDAGGAARMATGQAAGPDSADALRQSHAQLSRALFGNLV